MKKKLFFMAFAASALIVTSCSKDELKPSGAQTTSAATNNTGNTTTGGGGSSTSTTGTLLSPDASKTKLETSGQEMAAIAQSAAEGTGIQAIMNLMIMMGADKALSSTSLPAVSVLKTASAPTSTSSLKSFKADDEQQNDLQKAMEVGQGNYSWNSSTKKFEREDATGEIIVNFPFSKDETDNNVQFRFFDLKSTTSNEGAYNNNLLTGCKAYLKINGKIVMTYSFSASYDAKGLPTTLVKVLTIDDFAMNYSFVHSSSLLSSDYSITYKNKILFAEGFSVNGKLTEEQAIATAEYFNNDAEKTKELAKIAEFVTKASMYYQIMDAKIVGTVDIATLSKSIDEAMANKSNDPQDAVDMINKSVSLYAIFASTNERIAKAELYVSENTANESKKGEPAVRLVFADETMVDIGSYFGNINNFQSFIDEATGIQKEVIK